MAKYHKAFSVACYCPKCGAKSRVYDSRPNDDPIGLIRWRKCEQCGRRWKTVELMYYEFLEGYEKGVYDD